VGLWAVIPLCGKHVDNVVGDLISPGPTISSFPFYLISLFSFFHASCQTDLLVEFYLMILLSVHLVFRQRSNRLTTHLSVAHLIFIGSFNYWIYPVSASECRFYSLWFVFWRYSRCRHICHVKPDWISRPIFLISWMEFYLTGKQPRRAMISEARISWRRRLTTPQWFFRKEFFLLQFPFLSLFFLLLLLLLLFFLSFVFSFLFMERIVTRTIQPHRFYIRR